MFLLIKAPEAKQLQSPLPGLHACWPAPWCFSLSTVWHTHAAEQCTWLQDSRSTLKMHCCRSWSMWLKNSSAAAKSVSRNWEPGVRFQWDVGTEPEVKHGIVQPACYVSSLCPFCRRKLASIFTSKPNSMRSYTRWQLMTDVIILIGAEDSNNCL